MTADDRHAAQVALFRIHLAKYAFRLPERRKLWQARLADIPRAELREQARLTRLRERWRESGHDLSCVSVT